MDEKRVCEGYEVIKSRRIGKVEVVLAYNPDPKVPQQYVTWKSYAHTQFKDFAYGRYFSDKDAAEENFRERVAEMQEDYAFLHASEKRHKHDGQTR